MPDRMSLEGKVAVVTGGSRGIGLAIAGALLAAGSNVVITSRNASHLDSAIAELKKRSRGQPHAIQADMSNAREAAAAIDSAASHFGGLDVLVNNAGVGMFANVADMTPDQWDSLLGTNLSGVFYCCHAAIPHLRKRGGGWIINISSLAGKNAFPGGAAYCASKAGLNAFSEALMQEVRYDNIRVSYVMPGSVATGFAGRGESGEADWKIGADDVAEIVLELITFPSRSLPSRIEVRPSRPPKK
jgi:NAD(P)-dependent dehydrogenase (short-subunit alcohol dehydrogenase family)